MFMLEDGEIVGWLMLGMVNLAVFAAVAGSVVRTVLRQRTLENSYRKRMARWHAAAVESGPASESPAYPRAAPAGRVSSHCTRSA